MIILSFFMGMNRKGRLIIPNSIIVGVLLAIFLLFIPVDLIIIVGSSKKLKSAVSLQVYKNHLLKWGVLVFGNIPVFLSLSFLFVVFQLSSSNVNVHAVMIPFYITLFITAFIGNKENKVREQLLNPDLLCESKKVWVVDNVDGKWHRVEYIYERETEEHQLLVDEIPISLETISGKPNRFDIPVYTGSKECRLVRKGKDVDLVVDGVFLDKKAKYIPKRSAYPRKH